MDRIRHLLCTLTFVTAAILTGCADDTTTSPAAGPAEVPALPPAASMSIDMSFFDAADGAPSRPGADASMEAGRLNWINAVVRVTFINLVVADALEAPAVALAAAFSVEPVLGRDGWYVWTYAVNEVGENVSLELRARVDGAVVSWEMRVTDPAQTPPLDDFLWFRGQANEYSDTGHWIFFDGDSGTSVGVARVDWEATERRQSLSFESIDPTDEDFGDRLTYAVEGNVVAVEFFDQSENLTADITWDESTGAGSLQVPDYNDGDRACWDEEQRDADCNAAS